MNAPDDSPDFYDICETTCPECGEQVEYASLARKFDRTAGLGGLFTLIFYPDSDEISSVDYFGNAIEHTLITHEDETVEIEIDLGENDNRDFRAETEETAYCVNRLCSYLAENNECWTETYSQAYERVYHMVENEGYDLSDFDDFNLDSEVDGETKF